jgi:hypothetical protein
VPQRLRQTRSSSTWQAPLFFRAAELRLRAIGESVPQTQTRTENPRLEIARRAQNCTAKPAGKGFEGAVDYVDYVDKFIQTVDPDVLTADIYPFFEGDDDDGPASRAGYRANLAVLRRASLAAGAPRTLLPF